MLMLGVAAPPCLFAIFRFATPCFTPLDTPTLRDDISPMTYETR